MAPSENEFDTPALENLDLQFNLCHGSQEVGDGIMGLNSPFLEIRLFESESLFFNLLTVGTCKNHFTS